MRILLTNDDGIDAEGLDVLRSLASELADDANITVVAPAEEQSGVGHAITYTKNLSYEARDNGIAVFGTPADCVLVGIHEILSEPPDLILSGVNRGNNAGENAFYSGTLGAAIEAAMQSVPSIALSQFYGPALQGHDVFSATKHYGLRAIQAILDANIWQGPSSTLYYNVNFPPVVAENVKGHKFCAQGFRSGKFSTAKQGDHELRITGAPQAEPTAPGTDVACNLEGFVSITPCSLDLTNHDVLERLQK